MYKFLSQNDYKRDIAKGLKVLGGTNTVIHCHHYNSRIQKTIESNPKIDGQGIIRKSAAISYAKILSRLSQEKACSRDIDLAKDLYAFLGFGTLDFSQLANSIVRSQDSHFVEGWKCGAISHKGKVCRMTEGYIEGAIKAIMGEDVSVEETKCMNESGHDFCEFKVTKLSQEKYDYELKISSEISLNASAEKQEAESNIDKQTIIETVMGMPLQGNDEGLIPAFNVYLAHTPQDFYNLVSINFIEEMSKIGLKEIAAEMLVEDAENCALNTFGGILDSEEWFALIQPMIKNDADRVFGLIAVANALGWGRINITNHEAYKSLELESSNGYEAHGYLEFRGHVHEAQCFMLKGVSAGLMGLLYKKGDLEDRAGTYESEEVLCLCKKDVFCRFVVKLND